MSCIYSMSCVVYVNQTYALCAIQLMHYARDFSSSSTSFGSKLPALALRSYPFLINPPWPLHSFSFPRTPPLTYTHTSSLMSRVLVFITRPPPPAIRTQFPQRTNERVIVSLSDHVVMTRQSNEALSGWSAVRGPLLTKPW